ncbi:hypothetical protein [Okeania sp. SIO2B3]|uniref:hypothetical protein n=1 Tax=Okeania sp. SIO2B3 TaxID=2607784 RepID=UPI0013BFD8D3|nr:hypothetical protein [Okeania sp. SIO2B3]NET42450.1 hypothetical protein [Okeania sp. SIO2B3]
MAKSHGSLTGIEAKIEYYPVFEELGALNGCIGIDFNAELISVAYVKWDGNIEYLEEIPYQ